MFKKHYFLARRMGEGVLAAGFPHSVSRLQNFIKYTIIIFSDQEIDAAPSQLVRKTPLFKVRRNEI